MSEVASLVGQAEGCTQRWVSPCPGAVGAAALKLAMLFVILTQANPHLKLPGQTGPLNLFCKGSALSALLSWACRAAPLSVFSPGLLIRRGRKTLSTVGEAVSQPPCLSRRERGRCRLLSFPVSPVKRAQKIPPALATNEPPFLCHTALEVSTPGTGFALGMINLSAAEPQGFPELSPAFLVRWGWGRSPQWMGLWFSTLPGGGQSRL